MANPNYFDTSISFQSKAIYLGSCRPTMSTATAEKPPSQTPSSADKTQYLHHAAVAGLVISPALILLPPRKFDVYTVGLLTCTFVSANHLTYHYSGRSFATRWSERVNSMFATDGLPPKARLIKEQLRLEREERERKQLEGRLKAAQLSGTDPRSIMEEAESKLQGSRERNAIQKIWYGKEGDDWKQKRDEREKKALEEGKGYGDLIMDQIWEVWNWGQPSVKGKEEDEKASGDSKK